MPRNLVVLRIRDSVALADFEFMCYEIKLQGHFDEFGCIQVTCKTDTNITPELKFDNQIVG